MEQAKNYDPFSLVTNTQRESIRVTEQPLLLLFYVLTVSGFVFRTRTENRRTDASGTSETDSDQIDQPPGKGYWCNECQVSYKKSEFTSKHEKPRIDESKSSQSIDYLKTPSFAHLTRTSTRKLRNGLWNGDEKYVMQVNKNSKI